MVLDLSPALNNSEDVELRLAAFERELQQLRLALQDLQDLPEEVQELRAQVTILQNSNEEFANILRRSLVDDTHKFLINAAGPRLKEAADKEEPWDNYIERIFEELGAHWFKEKKLPVVCLGLLAKGHDSAFQRGCDAAHDLRQLNPDIFRTTYLAGLSKEEQRPWEKLYAFLSETSV